MNKEALVKTTADRAAVSQKEVSLILDALTETIMEAVAKGGQGRASRLRQFRGETAPGTTGKESADGATPDHPSDQSSCLFPRQTVQGTSRALSAAPPMDTKSQQEQWQTESTRRFGNDSQAVQRLKHTWPLPEVDAGDYDCIFLAGGHGTMWDFPTDPHLTKLIETFNREGKIIAAVCHGVPAQTPESQSLSRDLKQRGFKFVGTTIGYAFMQAVGLVNDHTTDCFRHRELLESARHRSPARAS